MNAAMPRQSGLSTSELCSALGIEPKTLTRIRRKYCGLYPMPIRTDSDLIWPETAVADFQSILADESNAWIAREHEMNQAQERAREQELAQKRTQEQDLHDDSGGYSDLPDGFLSRSDLCRALRISTDDFERLRAEHRREYADPEVVRVSAWPKSAVDDFAEIIVREALIKWHSQNLAAWGLSEEAQ